ncbi:MAG: helix-turn-helix domain-containing protein [Ruminococcaceae bacterium]|nr:helix-turn-helix domain-containing protein [Oscillospiraceae bacterium]
MLQFSAEQAMHLKHQKIGFTINAIAKSYIFLHFINPITFYIDDEEITTSSNSCIIFPPGSKLHYTAKKIRMMHNFLHFNLLDEKILEKLNIPINKVFYTNLQNEITEAVEMVESMTVKKPPNYTEIINNTISEMFTLISKEQSRRISFDGFSTQTRFDNLRTLIYQSPGSWSVQTMADYVNLSRSRFSTKYQNLFGITPNRDLTDAAMLYANKMLSISDICIADLAYECGFTSPDYFIRLYKKYYGTTPGSYRKKLRALSDKP